MVVTTEHATLNVALIGNPNTGKSTLFAALSGIRQQVGNYPGVTVEKKIGHLHVGDRRFALIDLPGTYSLAPRSPDEMVAVDVLLGRQQGVGPIGAVLAIVDASNLERNLYLVSQILELGLPTIVALNMVDVARARGVAIDVPRLSQRLGVPVIEVQANRQIGVDDVRRALADSAQRSATPPPSPFPEEFQREISDLQTVLDNGQVSGNARVPRYLVERLLLDSSGYLQQRLLAPSNGQMEQALVAARARLADAGYPVPAVEAIARYGWVGQVLEGLVSRPAERVVTSGDKLDRVLTNKFWGTLIFIVLMAVVFSAVFVVADPIMKLIASGIEQFGAGVEQLMSAGALRSLIVDGVIAGVGSVLVFLPQILILFFFIAVLEDCGYMARAAYLMDKLMLRLGLSGKSFIPLLSSFACAVPGIMATRVIENRRDRLTTILVAPLMSCSARLPVYTILIGAFIPAQSYLGGILQLQGLTLFGMYLVGMVTAAVVALILKRTVLRGPTPPFVMELPAYKWPSARIVFFRMFDRGWSFIYRAGTLILAVAVIVWAASYYPHNAAEVEAPFAAEQAALEAEIEQSSGDPVRLVDLEEQQHDLDNRISGAYQRQSYLGRVGKAIEPVVRPLGWDWRIGCAAIASFPAREVVVGTLGVIYNLGRDIKKEEEVGEQKLTLRLQAARWDDTGKPVYNIPVALSIMVFFALCAQCASTLVVIRRETNSWRWPIFTFTYMTALAYVGAFLTYQIGIWIAT